MLNAYEKTAQKIEIENRGNKMDERTTKSKTKKTERNFDVENLIPNYEFSCPWCGAKYKFPLGREMKMSHCMKCHESWVGEFELKK